MWSWKFVCFDSRRGNNTGLSRRIYRWRFECIVYHVVSRWAPYTFGSRRWQCTRMGCADKRCEGDNTRRARLRRQLCGHLKRICCLRLGRHRHYYRPSLGRHNRGALCGHANSTWASRKGEVHCFLAGREAFGVVWGR